jgi:2-keto-4-pentenoate hydratase/2-oxohepta-3-ene-1,7-dioic acid hydratase in catechol pathway
VRFEHGGAIRFGLLRDETIAIHDGDLFDSPRATGESIALSDVELTTPVTPSKMIALWNNFHALWQKAGGTPQDEPLYLLKSSNSFLAHGETIRKPASYDGKVAFEGELGVVIGSTCKEVSEADAAAHVFGYTCVNDVTAVEIINRHPLFAQWCRSKCFDTFGVFGPCIATGLDPMALTVRTVLNGQERQNYPMADLVFPVMKLVSMISHDMTLYPGDIIACGTSVGVGSMKPGSAIEIVIDGIGTLSNRFE